MAFKFFNIGKANAEIERLETELAAAKSQPGENQAELEKEAEKLSSDLVAARAEIVSLMASAAAKDTEISSLKTEIETQKAKVAETEKSVETRAATKAQQIVASIGHPAISVEGSAASQSGGDIVAELNAIKDPQQKMVFYRENKEKIDAAYAADQSAWQKASESERATWKKLNK